MIQRTRTKICGITNMADALAAVAAGADALGFVFYDKSPRYIAPDEAKYIITALPPFVQVVGLVVNASLEEIADIIERTGIHILQFHGDESPEFCQNVAIQCNISFIKALAVQNSEVVLQAQSFYQNGASAILLDAWSADQYGGTGHTFDWTLWPKLNIPLILAGGLTPQNVSQAIQLTRPYAVDVSGGVEAIDPTTQQAIKGKKDYQKMHTFIKAVQESDFEPAN